MGIKKQYLKNKPVCKVTFKLPKQAAKGAKSVRVVGDFNNWDNKATPMKSFKDGTFEATIQLEPNREYQFKYLINENVWENDWDADKYAQSPIGYWENSVIVT